MAEDANSKEFECLYEDEIQETIVNATDLRQAVFECSKDPIFYCIGQLRMEYHYSQYGNYKIATAGTGTVFHAQTSNSLQHKAFILSAAHNIFRKIIHCTGCDYYCDKKFQTCGCPNGEIVNKSNYKIIKATQITFKRRLLGKQTFGDPDEIYEDCNVEAFDDHYIDFPSIKSGYDWCILSFIDTDNYYQQFVSDIIIRPTFEIWNQCCRFSIFGYPLYEPCQSNNTKRMKTNGMYGMSAPNHSQKMQIKMDDMGTMNEFLYQTAIDTEGGQSGTAIFCKTKHLTKAYSGNCKAKTIIFGIHVGGSVRKPLFNVATMITNETLAKIYDIQCIPTAIAITKFNPMLCLETWRPTIVQFQAHIGIDFNIDGFAIAFAFKCGKKAWQQSQTQHGKIKEKLSVLLEAKYPYELIAIGLDATQQYESTAMKDKQKLLYFENFVLSLYHQEIIKNEESKENNNEYASQIKAINGTSIPTKIVFTHTLQCIKQIAMDMLQNIIAINRNNVESVQWILSIPSNLKHDKALMIEAAEEAGIKHSDIMDNFLIITQPEALSFFITKSISVNNNQPKKYMLLWLGEVHSYIDCFVVDGNKMRQIYPTQMATQQENWSSTCMDKKFAALLKSIFGCELMDKFKCELAYEWKVVQETFKRSRCYYDVKNKTTKHKLYVRLSAEFIKFIENNHDEIKCKNKCFVNIIEEFKCNVEDGFIQYDEGVLELSEKICDDLFDSFIIPLTAKMETLLKKNAIYECRDIVLGGELSKWKLIQNKIRNMCINKGYNVYVLPKCSLDVAEGAATIGLERTNMTEWTASKSIGIQIMHDVDEKKGNYGFCPLITKGTILNYTNTPIIKWFKSVECKQNKMRIKLYSTDSSKCIAIGFLELPPYWEWKNPIAIAYFEKRNKRKLYVAVRDWKAKKREIQMQWIN